MTYAVKRRIRRPGQVCDTGRRDEEIQSAAQAALRTSGYFEVRRLDCEIVNGNAFVKGVVSSFYLKQIAQSVLMKLDAIEEVTNLVRVK